MLVGCLSNAQARDRDTHRTEPEPCVANGTRLVACLRVQDVLRSLHVLLTVGGVVSSLSHRSSSHRNQPVEIHPDKLDKQESAQVSRHVEAH